MPLTCPLSSAPERHDAVDMDAGPWPCDESKADKLLELSPSEQNNQLSTLLERVERERIPSRDNPPAVVLDQSDRCMCLRGPALNR